MRQQIKEDLRRKMKKEPAALGSKKKLTYDNYSTFFCSSQPVIARRVIEESKSLTSKISNPVLNKKTPVSITEGTKPAVHAQTHGVINEAKVRAQMLRNARDYSFLFSDDAELPAPTKEPPRPPNEERKSKSISGHIQPHKAAPNLTFQKPARVKDSKQGSMHATKLEYQPKKQHAKRKFDDDELDYTSIIRRMFRYDPKKFAGRDNDDKAMEANFGDVQKDKRKSAKIAREEDERELRLIEEEEERRI